jgi:hypothetical protein
MFDFIIKLSFILYVAENEVNASLSAELSPLERAEAFLKVFTLENNPSSKFVRENIDLLSNEQVPFFEQTRMAREILEKDSLKSLHQDVAKKATQMLLHPLDLNVAEAMLDIEGKIYLINALIKRPWLSDFHVPAITAGAEILKSPRIITYEKYTILTNAFGALLNNFSFKKRNPDCYRMLNEDWASILYDLLDDEHIDFSERATMIREILTNDSLRLLHPVVAKKAIQILSYPTDPNNAGTCIDYKISLIEALIKRSSLSDLHVVAITVGAELLKSPHTLANQKQQLFDSFLTQKINTDCYRILAEAAIPIMSNLLDDEQIPFSSRMQKISEILKKDYLKESHLVVAEKAIQMLLHPIDPTDTYISTRINERIFTIDALLKCPLLNDFHVAAIWVGTELLKSPHTSDYQKYTILSNGFFSKELNTNCYRRLAEVLIPIMHNENFEFGALFKTTNFNIRILEIDGLDEFYRDIMHLNSNKFSLLLDDQDISGDDKVLKNLILKRFPELEVSLERHNYGEPGFLA